MPRFRLDEYNKSSVSTELHDATDAWCTVRKESGDAQLQPPNNSDYIKSVTEQKKDFSKYIRNRRPKTKADVDRNTKCSEITSSDHSGGLANGVVTDSIKEKDLPVEGEEGWLDEFLACQLSRNEEFYKILKTKAPNLEETSSLLDQVLELRSDLEDRVTELRGLGEEMRKITQLIKIDPFVSKIKLENKNSVEKVISSVRTMQNLCAEMDKQSPENVFC